MSEARWKRVKAIFTAAAELPREQQADAVRAAAEGDAELAGEVLELLARDTAPESFLQTPAELETITSRGGMTDGRTFDGLTIVERIGQGGMGTVYRARDTALDRDVAVKQLSGFAALDEVAVSRFRREARRVAALEHPSIIRIHRFSEIDGLPYFVMDYVGGHDLALEIDAQAGHPDSAFLPRFPSDDYFRSVAKLVSEVADALDYAHSRSIVHRDVKPHNILLDPNRRPFLVDFGIARDEKFGTMTQGSRPIGTLHYMSPEQARAKRERIDHRTDIYSLGVVLYELLTLRRPFDAPTEHEVLSRIISQEPPAPRTTEPAVPRLLEAICLKAMAKDAGRRYATSARLRDDLRGFLTGGPVEVVPAGAFARLGRWCRGRRKGLLWASAVVGAGLLAWWATKAVPNALAAARRTTRLEVRAGPTVPRDAGSLVTLAMLDPRTGQPFGHRTVGSLPVAVSDLTPGFYRIIVRFADGRLAELTRQVPAGPETIVDVRWPPEPATVLDSMARVEAARMRVALAASGHPAEGEEVAIEAFYLDVAEVSNREFLRYCEATGHPLPKLWSALAERGEHFPDLPVVDVSFEEMRDFAEWSGKRLPTALEWTLAARGPELREYPWTTDREPAAVGANAWSTDRGWTTPEERAVRYRDFVLPVRSSPDARTPIGIFHLFGNVAETTETPTPVRQSGGFEIDPFSRINLGANYAGPRGPFPCYGSNGTDAASADARIGFRCARSAAP